MLSLMTVLSNPAYALLLNEIMADPGTGNDSNCDGTFDPVEDEFVEIVNVQAASIDLSAHTLFDRSGVRHTFPPGSVLAPGQALVVYGGGVPSCYVGQDYQDVVMQVASTSNLGLDENGDTVSVVSPNGTTLTSYTYQSEAADEQSISRFPDETPSFMQRHTLVSPGGTPMSPGNRVDGLLFDLVGTSLTQPFPATAGLTNTWTMSAGAPSTTYYLLGSLQPGSMVHPACPGERIYLTNPSVLAQVTTNARGFAEFRYNVPMGAAGRTVYTQAASLAACDASPNLVTTRF